MKYTFDGTALNELSGLKLTCTTADRASASCIETGEYYIQARGYVLAYFIFCRFVAFLGVRFLKH